jgi:hypothetical protein
MLWKHKNKKEHTVKLIWQKENKWVKSTFHSNRLKGDLSIQIQTVRLRKEAKLNRSWYIFCPSTNIREITIGTAALHQLDALYLFT